MANLNKYESLINTIMDKLGGQDNLTFHTHCITRLRFNVKNKDLVALDELKKTGGVVGAQWSGEQLHVIIGQDVAQVYDAICQKYHLSVKTDTADSHSAAKKRFSIQSLFDAISGCITPLLPLLVGAGLVKVICLLLKTFSIISVDHPTYVMLNLVGDAGFYFLPVFTGWSAAKKFNTSIPLGLLIGAMMIHPNFVAAVGAGTPLSVFGLPIYPANYSSSFLPVIIGVYILSKVEPVVAKHSPSFLKFPLTGLIPVLVMIPVMFCVVGPIGTILGNYLGDFMNLLSKFGFPAFGIFAALYPFLVMTGMHQTLVPILFNIIATEGYVVFPSIAFTIPNLCQGAASAAVAVKTKDKELRSLAASTATTALVAGVTEPAMYGVNLKYKTPMIGVCIGSFVGACFAGIWGVKLYTLVGTSGLFALPGYLCDDPSNFIGAALSIAIGIIVSFAATMILYKESAQETAKTETAETAGTKQEETVFSIGSPLSGTILPLKDFPDETFRQELVGPGFGIEPSEETVYAPFDGTVAMLTDTRHAIGINGENGVELLIHVGVDTVSMNGKGFSYLVKQDQAVKKGQPLMKFSLEDIKAAGFPATTAVIVTNADQFSSVSLETEGAAVHGAAVYQIHR